MEAEGSVCLWAGHESINNAKHEPVRIEEPSYEKLDPFGNFATPSCMCVEGVQDEVANEEGVSKVKILLNFMKIILNVKIVSFLNGVIVGCIVDFDWRKVGRGGVVMDGTL